jgi:hypothetical protein
MILAKRLVLIVLTIWYGIPEACLSQTPAPYRELELINKKSPEKRKSFEVGDRVKMTLVDRTEKKGKILQLDSANISLKSGTFPIQNINSISRSRGFALDALGGVIAGAGMIMIFANLNPASNVASDQVKTETIVLGSLLTLSGGAMLYRKSYSQRKWQFHVISK